MFCTSITLAHPGHPPSDLAAEISQPLAGPDHLMAFIALCATLLVLLRAIFKYRASKRADR
jgi:hydrogenase/urease accessory protein HupE